MFVSYALNHNDEVYQMWNPNSSRIHVSRDVTCLRRMFYKKKVEDNEISVGITTEARKSDVPKASGDELPSPDDNNDNDISDAEAAGMADEIARIIFQYPGVSGIWFLASSVPSPDPYEYARLFHAQFGQHRLPNLSISIAAHRLYPLQRDPLQVR